MVNLDPKCQEWIHLGVGRRGEVLDLDPPGSPEWTPLGAKGRETWSQICAAPGRRFSGGWGQGQVWA